LRAAFADPALAGLAGRFHTHLTVHSDAATLAPLGDTLGARLTVIDLAGARDQRDLMLTVDHRGDLPALLAGLDAVLIGLANADIPVLRVKVEHGSLPTIVRFDAHRYREAHLKLRLPRADLPARLATLHAGRATWGYALSRNPREQAEDHVVQFVNLRLYEGDLATTDARIDAVVAWLGSQGMPPIDVRRETALLDTAQALDAWWA
jgi:hypothetical protein